MKEVTITLSERETLMVVSALGVFKDRIGQKARWLERKRMPTLRHRLADSIIIGDEVGGVIIRKALHKTMDEINRRILSGEEIAKTMNTLKEKAEITDERLRLFGYTRDDLKPEAEIEII